ncbi:MAG: hypothetical protein ACYS3N_16480 [Planctomycetota bacterium]|jgi:hypothetical protein
MSALFKNTELSLWNRKLRAVLFGTISWLGALLVCVLYFVLSNRRNWLWIVLALVPALILLKIGLFFFSSLFKITEQWLWNRKLQTALLAAISLLGVLFACGFYFVSGNKNWLWLAPGLFLIGLFFFITYWFVGGKVTALRRSFDSSDGEIMEGLIVDGIMQSPGIIVLKDSEIEIQQIVGSRITVSITEIVSVKVRKYFNGKLLIGKTGFWLTIPGRGRFGFAVANSVAMRWSDKIKSKSRIS